MESKEQQHIAKVGLYGGTFDPVHEGHLHLARHVLKRCRLDLLLFIPTLAPPHKTEPAASFHHRVAMLDCALAAVPEHERLRVSLIEEHLAMPSYTINTVQALISQQRKAAHYFFITGADSVLDMHNWRRPQDLLRLVNGIIVARDGVAKAKIGKALQALDPAYLPDPQSGGWRRQPENLSAVFLEDIAIPTSSSGIRAELACGQMPDTLSVSVAAYIQQHQLYGWTTQAKSKNL